MDYSSHIKDLRKKYVAGTPLQRKNIAKQRLEPTATPNKLILYVCAVEGLARSIAIHSLAAYKRGRLTSAYKKLKNTNPINLIEDYICPVLKETPEKTFGTKNWYKFNWACEYRNLLIHEATFLNKGVADPLIHATENVFNKLANIAEPPKRG